MVALLTVFSTVSTILIALPKVSASPVSGTISNLLTRQAGPIDPGSIPVQCESKCETVTNALIVCNDKLECICKDSILDNLNTCFGCATSVKDNPLDATMAQGILNKFANSCNFSGLPVKNATVTTETLDKENGAMLNSVGNTGTLGILVLGTILTLV